MTRSAPGLPDARELEATRASLAGRVRHTPLQHSPWLSERAGCDVYLKLECWQRTHSFKVRGALHAAGRLEPAVRARGLATASAGNHGLAVAHAAAEHGVPATIFVPASAPASKKRRIRRAGATLREIEGTYDDAARAVRAFVEDTGAYLLHPFDDPDVVAGQATVGLEIVDVLPAVKTVLVPVGGGGLAAGVGAALAAGARDARAVGVQSTATRAMAEAFAAGRVVPTPVPATLCDGLAGETEPAAFERARAALADLILVDEAAVAPAMRALYREEGIVAEGSGAVGVAAVLEQARPLDGPAVIVVSGGNIDGELLARILTED